jgi:hypothetical protein
MSGESVALVEAEGGLLMLFCRRLAGRRSTETAVVILEPQAGDCDG